MSIEESSHVAAWVGAISTLLTLIVYLINTEDQTTLESNEVVTPYVLNVFKLVCFGWGAFCLSLLLLFEPFGDIGSIESTLKFTGVFIALPAILILVHSFKLFNRKK